jgi:hypothetical protein
MRALAQHLSGAAPLGSKPTPAVLSGSAPSLSASVRRTCRRPNVNKRARELRQGGRGTGTLLDARANTKRAASARGRQPAHLMLRRSRCRSLRQVRRTQKSPAHVPPRRKGKRFMRWRGSHYCEAARPRRVDRRVVGVAVLVLAAWGHAAQ